MKGYIVPKRLLSLLFAGTAAVTAPLSGCGSKPTGEQAPAEAETRSNDLYGQESEVKTFDFRLSVPEPLVGRVVVTRVLERRGLETLQASMEWPIRIEPTELGLSITSGPPQIDRLSARLSQDALNQLLIGRVYLPSGLLDSEGTFRANEDTIECVSALHDALSAASATMMQGNDIAQFLSNTMSEDIIETTSREHWKTMVQSFIGKSMKLGEPVRTEAPSDLPNGASIVFDSELRVVSEVSCGADQTRKEAVRIEWKSKPKESMKGMLHDSIATLLPEGITLEDVDMTIDMVQVIDPATLVPCSLKVMKTTDTVIRLSTGARVPTREVSTETWEYHWEGH